MLLKFPIHLSPRKVFTTLLLMIPVCWASGQKLIVEDRKGRQKEIAIGRIVTVTTTIDSLNSTPFHFTNPADSVTRWCTKGCYTLASIDTISKTIQIKRVDGVMLNYTIEEIKSLYFVRARHPGRVKAGRIVLAVLGSIVIGQTIASGSSLSSEERISYSAIGAAALGYALLTKRNEPRKYNVVGITN